MKKGDGRGESARTLGTLGDNFVMREARNFGVGKVIKVGQGFGPERPAGPGTPKELSPSNPRGGPNVVIRRDPPVPPLTSGEPTVNVKPLSKSF